jgi:enoyl-CoA hydratase
MISADQALAWGLVNYVLPAGEAMDKAKAIIGKIAKKGPIAIAKTIEAINAYFQHDEDGFDREVKAFGQTTGTEDFKEGAAAFIEKRSANFTGR